jgi:hypothetical protein
MFGNAQQQQQQQQQQPLQQPQPLVLPQTASSSWMADIQVQEYEIYLL